MSFLKSIEVCKLNTVLRCEVLNTPLLSSVSFWKFLNAIVPTLLSLNSVTFFFSRGHPVVL